MTRKPVNPRPWHCIACGAELPPERQQGRCRECLIGKRSAVTVTELMVAFEKATGMTEHVAVGDGHVVPVWLRETFGLPPLDQP